MLFELRSAKEVFFAGDEEVGRLRALGFRFVDAGGSTPGMLAIDPAHVVWEPLDSLDELLAFVDANLPIRLDQDRVITLLNDYR